MSGAGGMIPHRLLLEELDRRRAEATQACEQDQEHLILHIRRLPPAERRIFLCSDPEASVLSAADRRNLMVESNAETDTAVHVLMRRQARRDIACWTILLLTVIVLAMTWSGLFQLATELDQARAEGRVPLPYEQQIALRRINDIEVSTFIDVPPQELRQRLEVPREMLDVWQRVQEGGAASSNDIGERRSKSLKVIREFLYVMAASEPDAQKNGLDLLSDLFGGSNKRSATLERLCHEDATVRK